MLFQPSRSTAVQPEQMFDGTRVGILAVRYREFVVCGTHVVPAGSSSCGGDVMVQFLDINKLSLPTPFFYSVLVSISVFMDLSTVSHSMNSPDNSLFSHSVLTVLSLSFIDPFSYISLYESLLQP